MLMAWTFIYAASHQAFVADFSVIGFLSHTKTFHDVFVVFTTPAIAPVVSFMVAWGHLLIGLSLLFGLMVRVSTIFGIALVMMYWMAHMDWPFIENKNNFIVDYHIVYSSLWPTCSLAMPGTSGALTAGSRTCRSFGSIPRCARSSRKMLRSIPIAAGYRIGGLLSSSQMTIRSKVVPASPCCSKGDCRAATSVRAPRRAAPPRDRALPLHAARRTST